ncbi:MAG: DUF2207 domain-containing protein [Schumannella sp.]
MPRRLPRPLAAVAALVLSLGVAAIAVPAASPAAAAPERPAGVDDFSFDSFDAQYYLGVDDSGHSTLRTVETLVAVFPAIDQNRGIVRYIPMSYGADPWDPKRVDTQVLVTSVTDENGDPVVYETFDDGYGFLGVSIDDDTYKHGRHTYVIEYTQRDVTRYFANTDDDEFYWDLNGTGWSQSFGSVSGTVHLDDGLASALNGQTSCYWGYEGDDEPCELNRSGDQFTVTQRDLAAPERHDRRSASGASGTRPGTRVEEHPIVTVCPDPAGRARSHRGGHRDPAQRRVAARTRARHRRAAVRGARGHRRDAGGRVPGSGRASPRGVRSSRSGLRAAHRGSERPGGSPLPPRTARPGAGRRPGRRRGGAEDLRQGCRGVTVVLYRGDRKLGDRTSPSR